MARIEGPVVGLLLAPLVGTIPREFQGRTRDRGAVSRPGARDERNMILMSTCQWETLQEIDHSADFCPIFIINESVFLLLP